MFHPGGLVRGWSGTTRTLTTVVSVTMRYRLVLRGSLPRTTLELLRSRFGSAYVRTGVAATTVTVTVIDEPALQALLRLIWDTGGQLLSLDTEPETIPPPSEGVLR